MVQEQPATPLQGRAQRLLAWLCKTATRLQDLQSALETGRDLVGRHECHSAASAAASSSQLEIAVTVFRLAVERVVHGRGQSGELMISQVGGKLRTPAFPGGPEITRTLQF